MTSPTRKTLAALQTMRGYLVLDGDSYRPTRVSTGHGQEERTWVREVGTGEGLGAWFLAVPRLDWEGH